MLFFFFCILFFLFKFGRYMFLLVSLEFLVLSVFFYFFFFMSFFIFFFLCISVLSSTLGLVMMFGLVNFSGKDMCLFYKFKLFLNY